MPPVGVFIEGTGSPKKKDPTLEKWNQNVEFKVQIIFSSISYTKFIKQNNRSKKFVTNEKGANASDYYLYLAEEWPKGQLYNDEVEQVIFIDCGSDDFGSATKNGKNEQVLRKYTSFAIMRLKDMLYRRSQFYGQTGKVHCQVLSIFPFHKCMFAISALLGKFLTDSDIYSSFIGDVISRPEYRYTFNWIYSYGWSIDVYYNAAFSPYLGGVGCKKKPKMKLNEINELLGNPERRRKQIGVSNLPPADQWVNKEYKKDENGDVTTPWGEIQNGEKKKITFYNKTKKKTTTYDNKDVTLTEWEPQDEETEVWVPSDPNVQKWKDPVSGKLLVRYEGQIFERDYLYDYLDSALHPSYDQLNARVGETHEAYVKAQQRADDASKRIFDAQKAGDHKYTKEYIDHEVENLVNNSGLTTEEAKKALAEQGFIPQNTEGDTMYFADGRLVTNDGLAEMLKAFRDDEMKALQDYLKAQTALEQRKISDALFVLNAAALVIGVVSFGATTAIAAAAFAIVDIGLNVSVVMLQIGGAKIAGGSAMDAFGSTTGERAFNIALTSVAIIADCISFVPLFKGPKGIHTSQALEVPLPTETPKAKSSATRKTTNARGETEWHQTITYEDGSTQVVKRNAAGETIEHEKAIYNGDVLQDTVTPNGVQKRYKNGLLEYEIDPKAGTKKEIIRNSDTGEIEGVHYYEHKMGDIEGGSKVGNWQSTKVESYKSGQLTGVNGKPVKDGPRIDKNGVKIDGDGVKIDGDGVKGNGSSGEKAQGGTGEGKGSGGDSGGANGANANNADTPIVKQDSSAEELTEQGGGTVSSNTGNGEQFVDQVKAAIWENSGLSNLPGVSEHGVVDWLKHDFIKLGFAADHWMCVFVALKSLIDSDKYNTIETESPKAGIEDTDGNGEINENTSFKEISKMSAQDTLDSSSNALKQMESNGDTSSQQYYDTLLMNESAEKAVGAKAKADALREYYETDDEIQKIKKETGNFNLNNQHNRDLVERRDAARQTVTNYDAKQAAAEAANKWGGNIMADTTPSPNREDFDNKYKTDKPNERRKNLAQADAEAQGAQTALEMDKYTYLYNLNHPNQ